MSEDPRAYTPAELGGISALSLLAALVVNRFMGLCSMRGTAVKGLNYASAHLLDPSTGVVIGTDSLSIAVSVVAFTMVFYAFLRAREKGTFRRGEEHGSARFATEKEMRSFSDPGNPLDNVILSKHARLRYTRNPDFEYNRNRNVLVVGGSGSGKTRGYIKPNLMQVPLEENRGKEADLDRYARSYFVSDPKGTTCPESAHVLAKAGYDVKQLNTIDMALSCGFNPLAYIHSDEDVMSFATCFIKNTKDPGTANSGDPFWDNAERLLYSAVICYMLTDVPEEDRNLVTMCELIDMGKYVESGMTGLDILFYEVEHGVRFDPDVAAPKTRKGTSMKAGISAAVDPWKPYGEPRPNHPGVLHYNSLKSAAMETLQSVFVTCKTRLSPLRAEGMKRILRRDEMHLAEFGERKMAMFAVMSASDPTYNFLHALLMWQMLNELMRRATVRYNGTLPVGVDFLLDEAAQFYIPNLEKTIAVVRSYNIGITVVLQSLAQLESVYKDDAATITDCCDTLVFLGGKSDKTNKSLEEQMGQQTVTTDNQSESHSQQSSWSESEAQHGRALMFASEISKLPQSKCLIGIRGASYYKDDKYDPNDHPCYKYIDPGHKGAAYARLFSFPAYCADRSYYDLPDAAVVATARTRLFTARPLGIRPPTARAYAVMLQIKLENRSKSARAFAVQGSATIVPSCPTNEGGAPTFPDVEPFGSAPGLVFVPMETRSSRLRPGVPSSEQDDVLEFLPMDKAYKLSSIALEPGEAIMLTMALGCDADDMSRALRNQASNNAEVCTFAFDWRASFSCANSDDVKLSGTAMLDVRTNGAATLSNA